MEMHNLRRTWAEIDLDALAHNCEALHRQAGTDFLGVVKADAYGHGAVHVARVLQELGAAYLAVSSLDEARELRQGGISGPVLVFGHTPPSMVGDLIEENITQTVSAEAKAVEYSQAAAALGKTLKVHIKVDTGMSRLGFLIRGRHYKGGIEAICRSCALPGLSAEGIYTHFAVSDLPNGEDYTREQFALFQQVIADLAGRGRTFALRHCANSGAVAHYPEMALDMVRPGIVLYGVGPGADELGLRPVMSLKSTVSTIKIYDPGTSIGYGRTFTATERTRIGVLPIGYADGLFRGLSNRAAVMTDHGPAPIRGRIFMDMTMVDLTELPSVKVGDEVEIFGQRQRADQLAAILDTIPHELVCAVSMRVPRVYLSQGREVDRSLRLL